MKKKVALNQIESHALIDDHVQVKDHTECCQR